MDKESLLHQICGKDLWVKVWLEVPDAEDWTGYAYIRVVDEGPSDWITFNYLSEFSVEEDPEDLDWSTALNTTFSLRTQYIEDIDTGLLCSTEELAEMFDLGYWIYGE